MTEAQFLAIHLQVNGNTINNSHNINVNYDELTAGVGSITGFTVTTLAQPESDTVDLFTILQRATSVSFTLQGILYNLPIESREQYLLPLTQSSFYYFRVNPSATFTIANLPPDIDQITAEDIVTSITPFLSDFEFEYGDYNALLGNSMLVRRSNSIVECDRAKSTTRPTNFNAILSGSATKAQIQDSNYSITGWTHARYDGTKTTTSNYGGVSPAVTGRTFQGEVYRAGAPTANICSQSLANRVIETLFFTGNTEFPQYSVVTSSFSLSSTIDFTQTNIPIKITAPTSSSIDAGTIVIVGSEKMRVTKTDYQNSYIYVERGYLTTPKINHGTNDKIAAILPVQIFDIDSTATNKTKVVYNSKIWMKETQEIIYTDAYGLVYDSGSCTI